MKNEYVIFLNEVSKLAEEKGFKIRDFSYELLAKDENGNIVKPFLDVKFNYEGENK